MSSSRSLIVQIKSLQEELTKTILIASSDDVQYNSAHCLELLKSLESITTTTTTTDDAKKETREEMTVVILNETKIGICLNKLLKAFRRYKRSHPSTSIEKEKGATDITTFHWEECMTTSQKLLASWKEVVKNERMNYSKETSSSSSSATATAATTTKDGDKSNGELPSSISNYRSRLNDHKKDMYKDPPVLPPPSIIIESTYLPQPKRSASSGEISFVLSTNQKNSSPKLQQFIKDFKPNRSPEEVLRAGSFGGTYFRPIVSSVTNIRYNPTKVLKETVQPDWIANIDKKTMLSSSTYNKSINKYQVKCGGSLGMWESSGWISDSDPYGWFQWYCNFYKGRRCNDDERQISRWLKSAGPKGRFRSQLCNKIFAQGGLGKVNDFKISPVIRQTLLHWGLEITEDVLRKHGKRVGKL